LGLHLSRVARSEGATLEWDAEDLEELRCDAKSAETFALTVSDEVDRPPSISSNSLERLRLCLPVDEVGRRHGRPQDAVRRIDWAENDETIRVGIRERTKQHRVADAEERRICAGADREAQNCDDRRDAAVPERSAGVTEISREPAHTSTLAALFIGEA